MAATSMRRTVGLIGLLMLGGWALVCGPAAAASLVGGARQAAIEQAFLAQPGHRGEVVVTVRVSDPSASWYVVKSVTPVAAGSTRVGGRPPQLQTTYEHRTAGRISAQRPPAAVRADLSRHFTLEVDYRGSGSEAVDDAVTAPGVCQGLGGFTDTTTDTVSPMRWSVRYAVDPDDLRSAVRGSAGATLVVGVRFLRPGSQLVATERLARTDVDVSCAGRPTQYACTRVWTLAPSDGGLTVGGPGGLQVGVPDAESGTGECGAADFTSGPSSFAEGDTTAAVPTLGLVGGRLPADPYAPIDVTSATDLAIGPEGFGQGPCGLATPGCTDAFSWRATVTVVPGAGG